MTLEQRQRSRRPTDIGVEGPTPRDMLRAFTSVRADPLGFLAAQQRRYGDLVAFPVPGPPVLLLNDPVDVRQVLQAGARHWNKETVQYAALARVTGPGLLASADASWMNHRRISAPAFHHQRLDGLADQVRAATHRPLADWDRLPPQGAVIDVADVVLKVALDIVGRTLFSADLSSRAQDLLKATSEAAQLIVALGRSIVPVPDWVPTRTNLRLRSASRQLDALCHDLIDRRRSVSTSTYGTPRTRDTSATTGSHDTPGTHGDDLLGLLVDGGLSDREIRDELVTMVVAGHETVAAALSWTLMLLAEDQPAQDRLRAEVRSTDRPVTMTDAAAQLPWTRAVVDEALRLYPPAWVVSRRSSAPDVIGGRDVPAGTTAIISPWLLHRRAESFPHPLSFRPERFLLGAGTRARSDYVPFGLGPRLCIGREFALSEMTIVLSQLLARHRVDTPAGWSRPTPEALVAVHPRGGMPLSVTPCGDDRR
ncbi:MAG: cytochrome P450 [Lapillicoccus sp.]